MKLQVPLHSSFQKKIILVRNISFKKKSLSLRNILFLFLSTCLVDHGSWVKLFSLTIGGLHRFQVICLHLVPFEKYVVFWTLSWLMICVISYICICNMDLTVVGFWHHVFWCLSHVLSICLCSLQYWSQGVNPHILYI